MNETSPLISTRRLLHLTRLLRLLFAARGLLLRGFVAPRGLAQHSTLEKKEKAIEYTKTKSREQWLSFTQGAHEDRLTPLTKFTDSDHGANVFGTGISGINE